MTKIRYSPYSKKDAPCHWKSFDTSTKRSMLDKYQKKKHVSSICNAIQKINSLS